MMTSENNSPKHNWHSEDDRECPRAPPHGPSADPCPPSSRPVRAFVSSLLRPTEAGDAPMQSLAKCMQLDAAQQDDLVEVLGRMLDQTVLSNDECSLATKTSAEVLVGCLLKGGPMVHFESDLTCPLCPSAYLCRMLKYTNASPCTFLIGLMYLQRLKDRSPVHITSFNSQRMLLVAVMLASKTYDDNFVSNKQWALVGDLELQELNSLEIDLLFALSFSMNVTREEYDTCREAVLNLDPAKVAYVDAVSADGCSVQRAPHSAEAQPREQPAGPRGSKVRASEC